MIRNRKKQELNVILSANELPDNQTDSSLFTRDTLCLNLLKVAKRRKMAETVASRYQTNKLLAAEFSYEEVNGELLTTITQVINAWEAFWKREKKQKDDSGIQLALSTDLSTFGSLTGYLVTAYKNNISKKYSKFKTEKRASAKQFIYLDSSQEEYINNAYEGLIAQKSSSLDKMEYNNAVNFLIKELREFDRKENHKQAEIYKQQPIPMKRKSFLAKLFVALLNPRYQGNLDQIRINFGWTDYIFKRNKEMLFRKLRNEHKDLGLNLLNFIINSQHDQNCGEIKEKEQKINIPKKLEASSVFGMVNEGNQTKYYLTVSINQFIEGRWKPIQVIKKHEIIATGKQKNISYDEAKNELSKKAMADLNKAQMLVKENSF